MYEAFFGLKRRPFAATPDPQCFLSSGTIQAALDEIVVCVEQGQGIAVVSAPAGTGKTLLCERLRSELGERFESILLRHASFLTRRALLQTILCELNHSYRQQDEQELRLELSPAIRALGPQREALVLICDEAHQLSEDLLEELRILSDLADHGRPLVRLVLVGQLGLEETLALSSLEALSQRIRAHVCLETLDRAGSLDYIDYRLTWAGGRTDEIFTPEALELIGRAADGVPRCINQLCDHALLLAYVAEQQPVLAETIREALQDLRQLPLHWNENSLAEPTRREAVPFETQSEFETDITEERSSTDDALCMESIEIGAALPHETHSQFDIAIEPIATTIEVASPIIEQPAEPLDTPQCVESINIDHEDVRENNISETPYCWEVGRATSTIVPLAPASFVPGRSQLSGGFTEELVLDRYAAIDAGLEPPELTKLDTTNSPQVHSAEISGQQTVQDSTVIAAAGTSTSTPNEMESTVDVERISNSATGSEPNSPELNDHATDVDFDEVCDRLDELLPQVEEDNSWDSAILRAGITTDSLMAKVSEEFGSRVSADSIEEQLGYDVCRLSDQLRETLDLPHPESSPVEQLRSLLSTASEDVLKEMASVEVGEVSHVEIGTMTTTETNEAPLNRASSEQPTTRPYRNLFSILRRKQQGLL